MQIVSYKSFKGELHSNYIFLYFVLIGLEWDSITLFTKMNFFPSKTRISTPFTQDINIPPFMIKSILIHEYQPKLTRIDTSQHDSTRVRHESTRNQHESTRIHTSPTRVNTNQHESDTSQHESKLVQHESSTSQHASLYSLKLS